MNKYLQGEPNYDKWPAIKVKNAKQECLTGWRAIIQHLLEQLNKIQHKQKVIVFECYQGVMDEEIISTLQNNLEGSYFFSKDCRDWGRMGLDGKPRPINIEHGQAVMN